MRCIAGHQANLYPYGGFFAKAVCVDHFVIVDSTQYVKKEWHNRNRIKLTDGKSSWLNIPVKTTGRFTQKINEVEIKEGTNWQKNHKRSLEFNYRKSQYFDDYFPLFCELLNREWGKLFDFNLEVIKLCFDLLGVRTEFSIASELGVTGRNSGLILDICRKLDGQAYLHGMHARDYVDFNLLKTGGIRNLIQDFEPVKYSQSWGEFIGNLAVPDILFNCGPESLDIIMSGNHVTDSETKEPVDSFCTGS